MIVNEMISSPHNSGRNGKTPELIVLHICDGTYAGTKSWFLNRDSQVSSHYIVGKDGRICQCVHLDRMAWCNGTATDKASNMYYKHSSLELVRSRGGNANEYSVSIECEGNFEETGGKLTPEQMKSLVWLIKYIRAEVKEHYGFDIPVDRGHIVGHCEITPKTRPNCPGKKFPWDELMARLSENTV